jgi:hypothetical protein
VKPENAIIITKVTPDIRNGKNHDNTNVLMAPKVSKTLQEGEDVQ